MSTFLNMSPQTFKKVLEAAGVVLIDRKDTASAISSMTPLVDAMRVGRNPGADYIRVAMVHDNATTAEALHRLVAVKGRRDGEDEDGHGHGDREGRLQHPAAPGDRGQLVLDQLRSALSHPDD